MPPPHRFNIPDKWPTAQGRKTKFFKNFCLQKSNFVGRMTWISLFLLSSMASEYPQALQPQPQNHQWEREKKEKDAERNLFPHKYFLKKNWVKS